ncbi:hypothetical protein MUK42_25962 [Musa troglodytarum]|uniref:Uncharacterized protein n=1 Tax=Musa troglodytarum TaxID=320322 RepID=A0A9E7IA31_9LILI|nr:hypothetical protein MUK42_25962 [Musa troglodytarum]
MKSRVGSHCLVFVNRERSSEVIMHEMLIPEADLHLRIKDLYAVGPLIGNVLQNMGFAFVRSWRYVDYYFEMQPISILQ